MSDDLTRRGRTTFTAALLLLALCVPPAALRAQVPPCGDGALDLGEECDEGPATGTDESCCAIDCTFKAASTPCRDTAGACDVADVCSGASGMCADAKSTAVCRPSAGVCDVAESCDGVANDCPADDFASASVECRAAAGVCDAAEHCTGSGAACPADGFQPDETPCDDANVCSINDRCIGGVCGGFLESCGNGTTEEGCFEECDDGNAVSGDGCDATCHLEPCGPAPIAGCRPTTVAGKAGVLVLSRLKPEKNRLQWKYLPGAATPKADFGDPLATTSFEFCVYDEVGGHPRLAARYVIPAGGTCGIGPCWKASGAGFKYTDNALASDGISSLVLKQGLAPGKTKILLAGKGADLPLPVLPLAQGPNVVMQLRGSNGVCWETRYGAPASRNQPDQFRDK